MADAWMPTLEDQIYCCTDAWAVRHRLVHEATGITVPMVCGTYKCKYCGPRLVEVWRGLVEAAEPERFLTLSRVGLTLVDVGKVTTVLVRRLRRLGYRFEYCATFERHRNTYYHVHMLQKGDYIPQKVLSDCLRTATHGLSYVVDIRRCVPGTAGYVTKYCTKLLAAGEVGYHPNGTRARVNRVRYSRRFFPSSTAALKGEFHQRKKAAAAARGEDVSGFDGTWKLQEVASVPRDERGRVIEALANEQYNRLVAERVEQVGSEQWKLSKGGRTVLAYMVLESLRLGEVAIV